MNKIINNIDEMRSSIEFGKGNIVDLSVFLKRFNGAGFEKCILVDLKKVGDLDAIFDLKEVTPDGIHIYNYSTVVS